MNHEDRSYKTWPAAAHVVGLPQVNQGPPCRRQAQLLMQGERHSLLVLLGILSTFTRPIRACLSLVGEVSEIGNIFGSIKELNLSLPHADCGGSAFRY
jgi:hypothetical protein